MLGYVPRLKFKGRFSHYTTYIGCKSHTCVRMEFDTQERNCVLWCEAVLFISMSWVCNLIPKF
jgi:hypothetical protein